MSKYFELSQETIIRIINARNAARDEITEMILRGEELHPSISKGNGKIGKCLNLSSTPGMTCGHCAECFAGCYATKIMARYSGTVINAWTKNTMLIKYRMTQVFEDLWKTMERRRKHFYVRFHVAGDLLVYMGTEEDSLRYLGFIAETAKRFSSYQVWTYTKMLHIVNKWIAKNGILPENLHIMASKWGVNAKLDNPYNLPTFTTVLPGETPPENTWHCPGNCDACKAESSADGQDHGCVKGENVWAEAHN